MWIEWLERTLNARDTAAYEAMRAKRDAGTAVTDDRGDAACPNLPTRLPSEECLAVSIGK